MLTKGLVGEKLGLVLECTASDNHSGEKYEHEVYPMFSKMPILLPMVWVSPGRQ
jgi:hypothetical protein